MDIAERSTAQVSARVGAGERPQRVRRALDSEEEWVEAPLGQQRRDRRARRRADSRSRCGTVLGEQIRGDIGVPVVHEPHQPVQIWRRDLLGQQY